MAKANQDSKQPVIRRIKASDDKQSVSKPISRRRKQKAGDGAKLKRITRPLGNLIGYFKGAWFELRQVRWPNRRATWSMTAALLIFTAVFLAFILVVDLAFESLFKLIIGN